MNKLEAEEKQEQIQKDLIAKMDTSKFTAHKLSVADAVKHFQTDLKKGLTSAEAAKRLEKYGPNELEAEEDKSLWESIVEQFEDILVRILLADGCLILRRDTTMSCRSRGRALGRAISGLEVNHLNTSGEA